MELYAIKPRELRTEMEIDMVSSSTHSGVFCWSLDHGEKRMKGDMNPEVVDLMICLLAVRLF